MAQLKAHATQLEEQARGAESRVTQLQSRVTEMEAQLHVTTDQLRMAQQRAEETQTSASAADVSPEIVAQIQERLAAAAEVEQVLRDELEASRAEAQRVQHELEQMELAHSEEARSQQGQLDQVRAQARLAEEERQRILAEAAKATAQEAMSADAESRIKELTQQLERSEAERAMLRAGRPETVYEARNRALEDEIAALRERPDGARPMVRRLRASTPRRSPPWRNVSAPRKSVPARPSAGWTMRRRSLARGLGPHVARTPPPRRAGSATGTARSTCRGRSRRSRRSPTMKLKNRPRRSRRVRRCRPWTAVSCGAGSSEARTPGAVASRRPRPPRRPVPSAASAATDRPRTCRGGVGRSQPSAATPAHAYRSDRPSRRARRTSGATLLG